MNSSFNLGEEKKLLNLSSKGIFLDLSLVDIRAGYRGVLYSVRPGTYYKSFLSSSIHVGGQVHKELVYLHSYSALRLCCIKIVMINLACIVGI